MMRPPLTVFASLCAIAFSGVLFAVTTAVGGAPAAGALFLLLPLTAYGCLRAVRLSRTALFAASIGAFAPLMVGVMMTWPDVPGALPYVVGATAIFAGLCGMLTPTARAWYASERAHGLLD
ncbi:MAG: hypothetical protein V4813_17000 [Gemmatimonadota bacterium]